MTFANIIIILECVVLIINVGTVIYKLIKPAIKIQDRIEALENHNMEDSVRIYKLEELSVDQSKILIQMLDRMIDGYNVEMIKNTRNKIIEIISN